MHAYIQTSMHAYTHTYTHTCMHAHIHTSIHTHTHMHACVHTNKHACIHTYINTYTYTYIHTCIHACMHTYIHQYIHTYIITYTHIHMYLRNIHYMFKYMPQPGCPHLHVPQTFTFNTRPKSRVVVGTVRVWSLSRLTFLWLASWANAYRAFPTIAGDSVPQARTSVTA